MAARTVLALRQAQEQDRGWREARCNALFGRLACARRLERCGRLACVTAGLVSPVFWVALLLTIRSDYLTDAPLAVWVLGQVLVLALASSVTLVGAGRVLRWLVSFQFRRYEKDGLLSPGTAADAQGKSEREDLNPADDGLQGKLNTARRRLSRLNNACLSAALLTLAAWGGKIAYTLAPDRLAWLAWIPPIAVMLMHFSLPLAAMRWTAAWWRSE